MATIVPFLSGVTLVLQSDSDTFVGGTKKQKILPASLSMYCIDILHLRFVVNLIPNRLSKQKLSVMECRKLKSVQ